jgi:hypothetical protein
MTHKHAVRVATSPQQAFRDVVYAYGVPEMAGELLMSVGTLYNKCEAGEDAHHKPTLRDVVAVTRISGDTRILESLDRLFDRAGYDVSRGKGVNDAALLELLATVGSQHGAMNLALLKSLEDAKFTEAELQAVRGEAFDLINGVLNFVQRLEGLVDD